MCPASCLFLLLCLLSPWKASPGTWGSFVTLPDILINICWLSPLSMTSCFIPSPHTAWCSYLEFILLDSVLQWFLIAHRNTFKFLRTAVQAFRSDFFLSSVQLWHSTHARILTFYIHQSHMPLSCFSLCLKCFCPASLPYFCLANFQLILSDVVQGSALPESGPCLPSWVWVWHLHTT